MRNFDPHSNLYDRITITNVTAGTPQPSPAGPVPNQAPNPPTVSSANAGTKQPCSCCGYYPCICQPITNNGWYSSPNVTTGTGKEIPTIRTSVFRLKNGKFGKGIIMPNGQTAYTPLQSNAPPPTISKYAHPIKPYSNGPTPQPLPFKGTNTLNTGYVYAPYTPIYNTGSPVITARQYTMDLPVEIRTKEIPNYQDKYSEGLLLHERTYEKILDFLNQSSPKRVTVPLDRLIKRCHEPLVCIGHRWLKPEVYTYLWACQGHGPILLDTDDVLRFIMKVQLIDDTGTNRDLQPIIDVINEEYLAVGDNSDLRIKMHGRFIVKNEEIINLIPEHLWWYENDIVIAS